MSRFSLILHKTASGCPLTSFQLRRKVAASGQGALMLKGFKQFILRGNVIDMAVGVVIGAAFATVVSAFTKDLLTPLIAAIVGKPDFSYLGFTIRNTHFPVGDFINAAISFLLVAAAVYYFVVTPVNIQIGRA